jgi:hypothetical protein
MNNYGKKMNYQNLVDSKILNKLGLTETERIAIESLVGLKDKSLTL